MEQMTRQQDPATSCECMRLDTQQHVGGVEEERERERDILTTQHHKMRLAKMINRTRQSWSSREEVTSIPITLFLLTSPYACRSHTSPIYLLRSHMSHRRGYGLLVRKDMLDIDIILTLAGKSLYKSSLISNAKLVYKMFCLHLTLYI